MEKLECKRRIMNINSGPELPPNIVKVIFSKLTICNLPICRLVCKTWNHLVLNYASSLKFVPNIFLVSTYDILFSRNCNCYPRCFPSFKCNPKMHCLDIDTMSYVASYEFENDDWPKIEIFNSCNGLLYIYKFSDDSFCNGILNLMTNEFFKLPQPKVINKNIHCVYGFGFSRKTKRYKLFKVIHEQEDSHSMMEILRFGRNETKEWKHFNCLPSIFYYHGAYLNGVVYWIGREKENKFVVYSLDVETEIIESVTVLEVGPYSSNHGYIGKFNDSVYATISIHGTCCKKVQLWVMRSKDSWIKECVIYDTSNYWMDGFLQLIKVFEDGERWFLVGDQIFCFDKTGTRIKKKNWKRKDKGKQFVAGFSQIESFNFGSLQHILAGDDII